MFHYYNENNELLISSTSYLDIEHHKMIDDSIAIEEKTEFRQDVVTEEPKTETEPVQDIMPTNILPTTLKNEMSKNIKTAKKLINTKAKARTV